MAHYEYKENNMRFKTALCWSMVFVLIFAASACKKKERIEKDHSRPVVVTTLFPLYDFTKNIAGDKAIVTLLLPPGVEPHSFEPRPGDLMRVKDADLFIYTGKFMEPWVEGILKGVDNKKLLVVDASKNVVLIEGAGEGDNGGHGRIDPHIWLDMSNSVKMIDNILNGLIQQDAGNKNYYTKNAEAYKAKLMEIDAQYRKALSTCKKHVFIHGGHSAFNYLARRYDIRYVAAFHGSPDAEPTPKRLIELKNLLKRYNLHYVYYEELITPRVADIISEETGAALLKLHGAHNISKEEMDKGITFPALMEENLKNLKVGLECQ